MRTKDNDKNVANAFNVLIF